MSEPSEYSESGGPVYRHKASEKPFEPVFGDEKTTEALAKHIEKYVGPTKSVFHELISHLVHIDVHLVEPTEQRPFYTLVTSGMSDRPMKVPEGAEALQYAELLISLPPDWPMDQESWKDENHYWPVRTLKFLARMPHEYDTWLSADHTVPNGDPPENFANTGFCCALLGLPDTLPEEFWEFKVNPEKTIYFFSVVPIYKEEMDLKLKKGAEALWERFEKEGITELLNVNRKNVGKKKFGLF